MVQYILACAAFMAVFCLPSSEGTAYHIHMDDKWDQNDDCTRDFKINGEGILAHFTTGCGAEVNRESLLNGVLVIGDYTKDRNSVYSDTPSSLVVIHGEGERQCIRRTYTQGDPQTEEMSVADCKIYKKEMSAEWEGSKKKKGILNLGKWKIGWQPAATADDDNMYVITTLQKNKQEGTCAATTEIRRNKLRYVEKYDDCLPRRVVLVSNHAIIGDYRTKDGVSRASYDDDSVVSVYPDRVCEKMIFKSEDGWVEVANMKGEDCEKYKRRVAHWLV